MDTDRRAEQILRFIRTKRSAFWEKERQTHSLRLFHRAAHEVPAYKDFLKKNRIDPVKIKTPTDFGSVPTINKKNYLRQYPLEKLMWPQEFRGPLTWTATSGSTGEPFYFSRSSQLDWEYSLIAEMYFQNNRLTLEGPTLVLVCLGMGVWIAGLLNYEAFRIAAERGGYPISILTPGINKGEIFKALKNLAPHFRQTILLGYPPFLKDLIDEAPSIGINLKKLNIRFLSGAEAFTENFRDYLVKKAHARSLYFDTLNIYGSADIGSMAFETPTAILIRRLSAKYQRVADDLFPNIRRTPTLAQYNPLFINFEAPHGEITLSGDSAIPLLRYEIGDNGGILSMDEIQTILKKHGVDLAHEANSVCINAICNLPFVYVYERNDFAVSLYGLKIYPEGVREALLDPSLTSYITGKFTMEVKFDSRQNQYWMLHLELRNDKKKSNALKERTLRIVLAHLRKTNSEFKELANHLQQRAFPKIAFWPYESIEYFRPGIKQKWVKKGNHA
jgi:phenylacetate-CoA ligase